MTKKDFARKYELSYGIVYEASYDIKPVATLTRDFDYNEEQLFSAVCDMMTRRIAKHRKKAEQYAATVDRIFATRERMKTQ